MVAEGGARRLAEASIASRIRAEDSVAAVDPFPVAYARSISPAARFADSSAASCPHDMAPAYAPAK